MNEQKATIVLLGTIHWSDKSKKNIENLTEKFKFDCFLSEGIDNERAYTLKNFVKEPFFLIATFIWSLFLKYCGKDAPTLMKIAEEKKIPFYFIDKNLEEVIKDGHKWYNYLIYLALFSILFVLIFHSFSLYTKLTLITAFSVMLYFLYFALITKKGREVVWMKNIVNVLKDKRFKNVLLICGELHKKEIEKNLAGKGYRVLTV